MSMEPTPALTPIGPFETGFKPVQEITPFTYQDGYTYLQKLEVLTYYVNLKLVGTVNDIITANAGFQTNVADTINAFTVAQNEAMQSLASSFIQYEVTNHSDGTIDYMMEDGSHISVYTVAGVQTIISGMNDRLNQFQITLNGAIQDQNNVIAANNTAQNAAISANNTAQNAAISANNTAQQIIINEKQWTHAIDFVKDCGADPTGQNPSDDAWNLMLSKLRSSNGGKCIFPPGRYRATTQWVNTTLNDAPNPPMILEGSGGLHVTTGGGDSYQLPVGSAKGTVFFSEWNESMSEGQYRFDSLGEVHLKDIAFVNQTGPNITATMVAAVRSTMFMERCSFSGYPTLRGRICNQDALSIGTKLTTFTGYGSSFKDLSMDRVQRQISLIHDANSVLIENVMGAQTCGIGLGGAVLINNWTGAQVAGNTIINYFIEGESYDCLFDMPFGVANTFVGPAVWDCWGKGQMKYMFSMAAGVTAGTCRENTCIGASLDGQGMDKLVDDAGWANTFITGYGQYLAGATAMSGFNNTNQHFYQTKRGVLMWNTDTNTLQVWNGTAWLNVATS